MIQTRASSHRAAARHAIPEGCGNLLPAIALIETGDLEQAQASTEGLESGAAARGFDMGARLLGLRARLARTQGKFDRANELFALALDGFGPDDPFLERTLPLHAHGQLQMESGERTLAAATLRAYS